MTENETRPDGVLLVCTGNICRSPMAAALLARHRAAGRGAIRSAGLRCMDGQEAHPLAQELMQRRGIDLSGHRARSITPEQLSTSGLILVMEEEHKSWIESRMPMLQHRVHLLGQWRGCEIPDPVHGGPADFERCVEQIDGCLFDWLRFERRIVEATSVSPAAGS